MGDRLQVSLEMLLYIGIHSYTRYELNERHVDSKGQIRRDFIHRTGNAERTDTNADKVDKNVRLFRDGTIVEIHLARNQKRTLTVCLMCASSVNSHAT